MRKLYLKKSPTIFGFWGINGTVFDQFLIKKI